MSFQNTDDSFVQNNDTFISTKSSILATNTKWENDILEIDFENIHYENNFDSNNKEKDLLYTVQKGDCLMKIAYMHNVR